MKMSLKPFVTLIVCFIMIYTLDQSDCLLDVSSTGMLLSNGECKCLLFHFWNKETSECLPNCRNNLSIRRHQTQHKKCICQNPAQWNQITRQCQLNCPSTKYSTGQNQWREVCECKEGSNWNSDTLTCDLNCQKVPYSTGQFDQQNNICICYSNHTWNTEEVVCQRRCIADSLHTGQFLDGKCVCVQGAKWDYYRQMCTNLNCDQIRYSSGLADDNISCNCEAEFAWDHNQYSCVLQCKDIVDELSTGTNFDSYQCNCKLEARWDSTSRRCNRQCEMIIYSTGRNINSNDCECQLGYIWQQSTNTCSPKCGSKPGQTGVYDQVQKHCECESPSFLWSASGSACYRDCRLYNNAYQYQGPSPDACECFSGYAWNSSSTSCSLLCNGQFDIGTTSGTQCNCEVNSIWIIRYGKCMVECNKDLLSTGTFAGDRCVCKANSMWNQNLNQCLCVEGFIKDSQARNCIQNSPSIGAAVSLGIIGGSIVAGALIYLGLYLRKIKKNKENQKPVDINSDQQVVQTVQDIKNNQNV